ncbi:MAG: LysM peptidoglycan-binding domain-containing protein [Endomicrobia bacterium]|nr:LysM peptidoglycan-binding domain-containing protein [Endomicrobiia bacterium]
MIVIITSIMFCIEYTVVEGDCLWNIAKQFYGNPFLWKKIYESNSEKIKDPNLIYPGQVFILPELEVSRETEDIDNNYVINSTQEETQQQVQNYQVSEQVISELSFPKMVSIDDFNKIGRIVAGEEKKFVYIDNDIIKINLEKNVPLTIGEIVGIYHEGPSQYNLRLSGMRRGQLSLVAKAKVLSVNGQGALCEIIRAYSPVEIGDLITVRH